MLDFSISKEQKMIRDEFSRIVKKLVCDQAHEMDENGDIPMEVVQPIWEMGASISSVPERYGGLGAEDSPVETAIILEELAYGDMAVAITATLPSLFIQALLLSEDETLMGKYLPYFCSEKYPFCSIALNESHFRFDPANLSTTATKEKDAFILSGSKCFVPFARRAEYFLVAAVCDDCNRLFIVSKENPGLKITKVEKNLGLNAMKMYQVEFNQCLVSFTDCIGWNENDFFDRFLHRTRLGMAALATGIARASYEFVKQYAKERHQFKEPIAHRQSIAFMIAEMAYEVDAMRLLTWKGASALAAGKDASKASYLAKLFAGEKVMKICDYGVQIMGGHGFIREYPVERYYRNSRGVSILEGLAVT